MTTVEKSIYDKALEIGFDACGFASIDGVDMYKDVYNQWLSNGNAADMQYLYNAETRFNPKSIVEDARSVIVVLLNYFTAKEMLNPEVAKYAQYVDYHTVIYKKLNELISFLPEGNHRSCCDSMPIAERVFAAKAGLGWIGKSGMLINSQLGSYTFIGCIVTSLEMEESGRVENRCGNCRICVEACPTHAILEDKTIDARKCISYHTIENRSQVPQELIGAAKNILYGCDRCISKCPWNRCAKESNKEILPLLDIGVINWESVTNNTFRHILKDSPMRRAGAKKIRERARIIKEQNEKECI